MKRLIVLVFCAAFILGCNSTGTPVEYANACDKAYDDQNVEFTGYFNNRGTAMCSKSGKDPMRCPIDFVSAPGAENPYRAYIDKGSGSSSIDAAEGKPLEIKDNNGEIVDNKQKVKIVATVNRLDSVGSDSCYLVVRKIEKAQ